MLECSKKWYNYTPQMEVIKPKESKKGKRGKDKKPRVIKEKPARYILGSNYLREEIIITNYFNVDIRGLVCKHGKREITEARQIIWYFLYQFPDLTQQVIGERYGVHHSSVKHGLDKVADLQVHGWYKAQLIELEKLLKD